MKCGPAYMHIPVNTSASSYGVWILDEKGVLGVVSSTKGTRENKICLC